MKVEQLYTGCLAQGAYYIESAGEAAIIDPLRETSQYIRKAEASGAKIKYILETHFHADFVSGHLDLAAKTGAQIVYGPDASTDFTIKKTKDGEVLKLGKVSIKILHTPGHTPESTTFLLKDEKGHDYALFTGDTLFIGDVGRPDLAQKVGSLTKEDLAGWLYDSLRNKIMPLADEVLVYPAHGAGSACGKNMSSETFSTLGQQKASNYALRHDMTREEFIQEVTDGLLPPPQYFAKNAKINKTGYESLDTVMHRGYKGLSPRAFQAAAEATGAIVLDVRDKQDFCDGYIPGSIFIGLDGTFAPWVGALIPDLMQPILLIAPKGKNKETIVRLARVGYDNCIGYLEGGFDAWKTAGNEVDSISCVSPMQLDQLRQQNPDISILDVRKPGEWNAEHILDAQHFPLDYVNDQMEQFRLNKTNYLHCRSGYRSTIAASILKARGFQNLVNVMGSFEEILAAGIPTTQYVCPSTLSKN